MDAAFENPLEHCRVHLRTDPRRMSMEKPLTEPEFARAVSEGLERLIAMARRLAGDEEIAAEAVQNALLKASRSWRKFRGRSQVQTWLTKIVIHSVRDAIAADQLRRRHVPVVVESESPPHDERVIDPGRGPCQKVLDEELDQMLRSAVRQLPDRQREVFALVVWQELSASEAGELLDINAQTVHANLHAARKHLRQSLSHLVQSDRGSSS